MGLLLWCSGISLLLAHGNERGLVMLLPTGYYITASAIAVIASFALLAWIPASGIRAVADWSVKLFELDVRRRLWPSLVSLSLMCFLLASGYLGNTDPLANPLPLFIWTWWWVGFTLLQCVTGNLWHLLNPWTGIVSILRQTFNLPSEPVLLPEKLGYFPAIIVFFGFTWFELMDLAPEDPRRLVNVVSAYWFYTFTGCLIFGDRRWFQSAEPFSIFFRLVGNLSPFIREPGSGNESNAKVLISLAIPGKNFLNLKPLPFSGVLFVLRTLSAVSFDGLSKTFSWLGLAGINPLAYPGRSAMVGNNTLGLLFCFFVLTGAYLLAVYLGCKLTARTDLFPRAAGRLIYSIIPISLVFHLAHYLTLLLTNSQYSLLAFNDPFGLGWNLLAAKNYIVTTSFLTHFESVSMIWILQTVAIAGGHIIGITLAHLIAVQLFESPRAASVSQSFLALLMVLYTVFGLWLLSTPAIS